MLKFFYMFFLSFCQEIEAKDEARAKWAAENDRKLIEDKKARALAKTKQLEAEGYKFPWYRWY